MCSVGGGLALQNVISVAKNLARFLILAGNFGGNFVMRYKFCWVEVWAGARATGAIGRETPGLLAWRTYRPKGASGGGECGGPVVRPWEGGPAILRGQKTV